MAEGKKSVCLIADLLVTPPHAISKQVAMNGTCASQLLRNALNCTAGIAYCLQLIGLVFGAALAFPALVVSARQQ